MNDIAYRLPAPTDRETLLSLSREAIGMTDVYTYGILYPDLPQNSRLWLGEAAGGLCIVLYDNGDYFTVNEPMNGSFSVVRASAESTLFQPPQKKDRLVLMEYRGAGEAETGTAILTGKELLNVWKLLGGTQTLSDALEKRYVESVRGVHADLCAYRGIYENGMIVSCGGIVASNEKYALIGNVFTAEKHRGRGLAAATVRSLIGTALQKERIPVLYCEKNMTGFYRKLGFFETER